MSNTDSTQKRDVYARVTDQIVIAIEQGAGTWKMPWHTSGRFAFSPMNVASRKPYRGINTVCLWAAAQADGYESGEWGTYAQWQERGAQVRKGEKSTLVVFWKFADGQKETEDDGDTPAIGSRLLFACSYSVFNAAQVNGYVPRSEPERPEIERIADADRFFEGVNADIRHGGNQAYYSPVSDHVQMPPLQAFRDSLGYYSTLAHECTHWTSHPSRCDRQLGKQFGDHAYAVEELVAELGAAFTMAHLGLSTEPRPDHAQYIQSWLKVLKADKRAIFTAGSKAQQACDWLTQKANPVAEMAA